MWLEYIHYSALKDIKFYGEIQSIYIVSEGKIYVALHSQYVYFDQSKKRGMLIVNKEYVCGEDILIWKLFLQICYSIWTFQQTN